MDKKGFTLIELMIVISIILSLSAIGFFPYSFYMQRVRVENTIDTISQEWIMAHQKVRNGQKIGDSIAHTFLEFTQGSDHILLLSSTGSYTGARKEKEIIFDDGIEILDFSGVTFGSDHKLLYHITPPFGTGVFSTGNGEYFSSGIIMKIGYPKATEESRRVRNILLRPYYD